MVLELTAYLFYNHLYTNMARAHYIVRVGNAGVATKISHTAPNHWHYLSPQHLWGFPRTLTHVNVRAQFEADIENPQVTAYIWFLCNGHGGPGHFVQVGIGRRHLGQGPVANGDLPIAEDMMARLQHGFDHWFEWRPLNPSATFQNRLRQLPIPRPHFIPTLRRVTAEHSSFPLFEALVDSEENGVVALTTALPAAAPAPPAAAPPSEAIEVDLENLRREHAEPHSQGHVYLINMQDTAFYKIGMSLDPQIRLRTLQTGNPYPLQIINTRAVPDMRSAETRLHRQFEAQRVPNPNTREWFDFSDVTGEVKTAFGTV